MSTQSALVSLSAQLRQVSRNKNCKRDPLIFPLHKQIGNITSFIHSECYYCSYLLRVSIASIDLDFLKQNSITSNSSINSDFSSFFEKNKT